MVEIKEVKTGRELRKFIKFPFKLYKHNEKWVPPLIFDEKNTLKKKNPAFDYCESKYWLVYKDGKVKGRIAGIINKKYIDKWGKKYIRFGWIDFIDDFEVSKALIDAVEKWGKEMGMEGIHGPLGFCDLDKEGLLIEGFDEKDMFITIYNYPYYSKHLEKMGFDKDVDWLEYEIKVPDEVPGNIEKLNNIILKRLKINIIRSKNTKDILPYAEGIFKLLNEAYKNLYGVVALTDEQIKAYTKQYFGFLNADYLRVITDENGKVVAFGIAAPSMSKAVKKAKGRLLPLGFIYILKALNKNDRLDLYLVAVAPEYQGKGLNILILNDINKTAVKNGIKFAETGPELEYNKNVQGLWKYYETRQHRRRRCYYKNIESKQE